MGARIALIDADLALLAEIERRAGRQEVTMFQPMRPPLIWSSEANWRARL